MNLENVLFFNIDSKQNRIHINNHYLYKIFKIETNKITDISDQVENDTQNENIILII